MTRPQAISYFKISTNNLQFAIDNIPKYLFMLFINKPLMFSALFDWFWINTKRVMSLLKNGRINIQGTLLI